MSDFDDILGGGLESERPKRSGRPTNEERARRAEQAMQDAAFQREVRMAGQGKGQFQPEDFFGLCSQNQIARLMHMDPMTVKRRLTSCKPAGYVGAGRPVYYFHDAIPHLVKPKMDIATYLKTLNPTDMPPSINKTFWEAERIKNKVLVETGEAWHDSAVLEVLGRVFMMIKDRIPIINEGMREAGLTDEQSNQLTGYTDQMQSDLYDALVEMPKQHQTLPRRSDIEIYSNPEVESAEFEDDA